MMMNETITKKIEISAIIAVLVIDDAADAVPLAKALLRGGVDAIELTLRTPAALDALLKIKAEVPGITAGIGTILTPVQVREAKEHGADFGVAPGYNPTVLKSARIMGLPYAPGVSTASEIETAYEMGCKTLKLFPAESLGGISYLESVNAPYAHLGIRYIPLGGVGIGNLKAYLENEAILAVGGSWLAPRKLINEKNWDRISKNCEEAIGIVREVRGK
ncbi:MAG: bifunctional 4-hydroxy-2-oxoglutarate aldolase/2-dehydro-3-deoxy-phosphogluconate aldolase [Spirochaetaceae bacterium]|jgi:2-dehydro-3-deoxyphosphogluconate aldolase/(4S)-4-hydroxy-2-oxoglutarate aldolase|nr:bifunctional 4-hydroxy-2-oxoglutarate aldolase/2-dehydro-3-deoxy-phosphogluconate aldolase [Spirochaetaceae bacterium]